MVSILIDMTSSGTPTASTLLRFFFSGSTSDPIAVEDLTSVNCVSRFSNDGTSANMGVDITLSACRVARAGEASSVDGSMVASNTLEVTLALAFSSSGLSSLNNLFSRDGDPPLSAFGCYPVDALGPECTVKLVDVLSMDLSPNPVSHAAATLPRDVSYQIVVSSDSLVYPPQIVATRITEGLPSASQTFPATSVVTSSAGTPIGLPGDGLRIYFAAVWGHTRNAAWTVRVATDAITGAESIVVEQPSYREFSPCSGVGKCDASGACVCAIGTEGPACNVKTAVAVSTPDQPIFEVTAEAADYAGSVLRISSQRPLGSADFDFLSVVSGQDEPFFRLRGDGLLSGSSAAFAGGVDVDGGVVAQVSTLRAPFEVATAALSVYYGSSSIAPSSGVAVIVSEFPIDDSNATDNTLTFEISARLTAVESDPLAPFETQFSVATNGVAAANFGMDVAAAAGGLSVHGDGIYVDSGGINVTTGGLEVGSGGFDVTGNSSFHGDLHIYGSLVLQNGTINLLGPKSPTGVVINDALIVVNEATMRGFLTAESGFAVLTGGAAIDSGGLHVGDGGIKLDSGGISAFAGGGIFTHGGLSVTGEGLVAANDPDLSVANSKVALAKSDSFVSSFYSGSNLAWAGDVVYGEAASPMDPGFNYNLLRFVTRPSGTVVDTGDTVRIDGKGDMYSTSNFVIGTEATAISIAGHVSVVAGTSSAPYGNAAGDAGGNVVARGGGSANANGGDGKLMGGTGALGGGHAYVVGGASAITGGNVFLQPGLGGVTNGNVYIQDASGTDRLTVTGNGDIILSPAAGTVTSIAAQAPIVTSATYLSMMASVAALVLGQSYTDGHAGGQVSIVGGDASASANAGSVQIAPGISSTGLSGDVRLQSSNNVRRTDRIVVSETSTSIFSDDGSLANSAAVSIVHGATAAASAMHVSGSLSVNGVVSAMGARVAVGGDLIVDGSGAVGGALGVGTTLTATNDVVAGGGGLFGGIVTGTSGGRFDGDVLIGTGGGVGGLFTAGFASFQSSVSLASTLDVTGFSTFAGGASVSSSGIFVSGGVHVTGPSQLQATHFADDIASSSSASFDGDLSVGGDTVLTGNVLLPGMVTLRGSLSLDAGSVLTGDSTQVSLTGPANIDIGGALSVGGSATVGGNSRIFQALEVGTTTTIHGDAFIGGDAAIAGKVDAAGTGHFELGLAVGGPTSIFGAVRTMSDVVLSAGTLSVSPVGGVVGAPMLIRSSTEFAPGSATALSIVGGDAQDGDGGTVFLQGGRKGGDHYAGSVILSDSFGAQRLRVDNSGVYATGGAGNVVSLSPIVVASGTLSVTGATSLMSTAYVGVDLDVAGSASVAGTTTGLSFLQAGASGSISYQGRLAGSGWLDPGMLHSCDAVSWSLGGSCYGLFSESPGTPNTHVILHFNFDTVAHAVLYGSDTQIWIDIPPGGTFPVYISSRRRRVADIAVTDKKRL